MIITIRHGERADMVQQLETKFIHDPPLSKLGVQQCKASGIKIQSLLDTYKTENPLQSEFQLIVISSPYLRTVQTAYYLLAGIKEKIYENTIFLQKELGEIFTEKYIEFDPMEKLFTLTKDEETYEEIKSQCDSQKLQLGGSFIATELLQQPNYPESQDSGFSRIQIFYQQLMQKYQQLMKSKTYVILCVTHQYCLECAQCALTGEELKFGVCGFCGIVQIAFQDIVKSIDDYKVLLKGENDVISKSNQYKT